MKILTESKNYIVFYEFEAVILEIKESKDKILIGDFYGEPQMAIISEQEDFCAMCGCGVIIYYLQPPFMEYEYHKQTQQWKEWGRINQKEIWVETIKYVNHFILEIETELGEIIRINPYTLSIVKNEV